jgi:uncharacterized metal-binding protein
MDGVIAVVSSVVAAVDVRSAAPATSRLPVVIMDGMPITCITKFALTAAVVTVTVSDVVSGTVGAPLGPPLTPAAR